MFIMWSRIVASVVVLLAMAPAAADAHGRRDADGGDTKPVDPVDVPATVAFNRSSTDFGPFDGDPATVVFNRGSDTDVEPTPVRAHAPCCLVPQPWVV